ALTGTLHAALGRRQVRCGGGIDFHDSFPNDFDLSVITATPGETLAQSGRTLVHAVRQFRVVSARASTRRIPLAPFCAGLAHYICTCTVAPSMTMPEMI